MRVSLQLFISELLVLSKLSLLSEFMNFVGELELDFENKLLLDDEELKLPPKRFSAESALALNGFPSLLVICQVKLVNCANINPLSSK